MGDKYLGEGPMSHAMCILVSQTWNRGVGAAGLEVDSVLWTKLQLRYYRVFFSHPLAPQGVKAWCRVWPLSRRGTSQSWGLRSHKEEAEVDFSLQVRLILSL